MDQRLETRLEKVESFIEEMFPVEQSFLKLEGEKDYWKNRIIEKQQGKSHAEKESRGLSSDEWLDFVQRLSAAKLKFNLYLRRYNLLLKAFDAEYTTYKVEASAIKRQL